MTIVTCLWSSPWKHSAEFLFSEPFSAVTSIRPLSSYSFLLLHSLRSNSLLQMRPKAASIYHCHQSIPFFCLLTLHPPIPITGCLFFHSYKFPMQLWIINFQQMGCWWVLGPASSSWLTDCLWHAAPLLLPGQMNETLSGDQWMKKKELVSLPRFLLISQEFSSWWIASASHESQIQHTVKHWHIYVDHI